MIQLAYLFERFPSFTQTFCYREVMELRRQGLAPTIFSIRQPANEPPENWDTQLVRRVHYLPEEKDLLDEVERAIRRKEIPSQAVTAIKQWGRQTDFLRLYQAAYIGMRLSKDVRLHAHFAGMAARTAYWIKEFFGIPFSFTAHANDIFVPRAFVIALDRLVDSASFVITESDHAAKFLAERFPECANKIHRIYNGLDLSNFVRADLTAPIPLIISIGRLIEKKGFADLVEACRLLAAAGREFRCEIIGEGPLENTLRAQIERSHLQEKVALIGPQTQEQIKERLAAATVFALPCTTEAAGGTDNLPTVIMEAMAAGLPVVSTPIAGVPEMVQDGVTGELVQPNEPIAVAQAIEKFLINCPRAREFGGRGWQLAQKKFAIETSVRALLELFQVSAL
jgi:colanic acid/amylovoran biosynthesis glycosyltransferase